jgi:hypothetical protein
MHLGCCWTGPSTTQQSWSLVQQSVPQHVVVLAQVPPWLVHGGFWQVPPMHVDFSPVQWVPQPPQLNGSSYVSTHSVPQHVWPLEQTHMLPSSSPPLLEPLELPELLPLLEPLELPEPLPLLLPLDPPDPLVDEPLPLPEVLLLPELPVELPPPSFVASTEASDEPLPSVSVAPPHRAVRTTRPARPAAQTK